MLKVPEVKIMLVLTIPLLCYWGGGGGWRAGPTKVGGPGNVGQTNHSEAFNTWLWVLSCVYTWLGCTGYSCPWS